jgi:hypothetical protein
VVDATDGQVVKAADQLPTPNPPNGTA